mmetsp:Transcript_40376/g.78983  ORF Transcript_40376/g.78983 Transcript_40376/m.78983 type:complete len:188 (+) Transcript_40376:22-585(+)
MSDSTYEEENPPHLLANPRSEISEGVDYDGDSDDDHSIQRHKDEDDGDDDDGESSEIIIEPLHDDNSRSRRSSVFLPNNPDFLQIDDEDPLANARQENIYRERRRLVIHQEISMHQRMNFLSFLVLFLIPTTLLLLIVVIVFFDDSKCTGISPHCANEIRILRNAFTSRCVCDSVTMLKLEDIEPSK